MLEVLDLDSVLLRDAAGFLAWAYSGSAKEGGESCFSMPLPSGAFNPRENAQLLPRPHTWLLGLRAQKWSSEEKIRSAWCPPTLEPASAWMPS